MLSVTPDSGGGKRRLEDIKEARESLKGVFKGHWCWGLPQQLLATISCVRGFEDEYKERTLESSAKTLRSSEIKGELSRFKLGRKVQEIASCIYTWRPGAWTKQCS